MATPLRIIMAVENGLLRRHLLEALAPLNVSPELMSPGWLLHENFTGVNLIFLEASNDVDQLAVTAEALRAKWGDNHEVDIQIMSYSTPEITPDEVVFRLWNAFRRNYVIVQCWNPATLDEYRTYAYNMANLFIKATQDESEASG